METVSLLEAEKYEKEENIKKVSLETKKKK